MSEFIYNTGPSESSTNETEAYSYGREYYEKFLKPVLPGLEQEVDKLEQKFDVQDSETVCIFLDRDARPAMYAWKKMLKSSLRKIASIPIPVTSTQQPRLHELYREIDDYYDRDKCLSADEWSELFTNTVDTRGAFSDEKWIDVYRHTYTKKIGDKKLIIPVDIGYRGSSVEVARYLLSKSFPEKEVVPILLYKYDHEFPPTRSIISDETTWYAESMPQTIRGYQLDKNKNSFRYLHHNDISLRKRSHEFYKGLMESLSSEFPKTS